MSAREVIVGRVAEPAISTRKSDKKWPTQYRPTEELRLIPAHFLHTRSTFRSSIGDYYEHVFLSPKTIATECFLDSRNVTRRSSEVKSIAAAVALGFALEIYTEEG
jgi:hypothetical protein